MAIRGGGLLGDVLIAKLACDLVHILIECTQLDEVVEGSVNTKDCSRGGVSSMQVHQVGIGPLTIELALWVTHTIASGVNACTSRQLAIVVCHLCYDHRYPENRRSECGSHGGAPFTTIVEEVSSDGHNHPPCRGRIGTFTLINTSFGSVELIEI